MNSSRALVIISSLLITSCSFFSSKIDTLAESKSGSSQEAQSKKINFCSEQSRLQYLSEDEATQKFYKQIEPVFNRKISFIQKGIMMALLELNRRPDKLSPSSRLQVYIRYEGTTYYFDFRPRDLEDVTKNSYLYGLNALTQKFLGQTKLAMIADDLDASIPQQLPVSLDFEQFLDRNKSSLAQSELMASRFMKGDETITRYETFHRMSFKNIVNRFTPTLTKANEYSSDKSELVPFNQKNGTIPIKCNVNINQEVTLSDDILGSENSRIHTMGLIENDNIFLAVSSGLLQRPLVFEKNFIFMKMRPLPFPSPLCELSDTERTIALFSAKGRSPAQHLRHLIAYEVGLVRTPDELNELLKFSRHLFLNDPDRILYESKRGRKTQLDFFLAMKFPIYHAESLGDVFGSMSYKQSGYRTSLIVDDREQTRLTCLR